MDAGDFFILHKLLALPVVDEMHRIVGVVDVGVFTDEVFDVARREQLDEVFETIGFRVSQVRDAAPARAFRFRFPRLAATMGSGTLCALLAGAYNERGTPDLTCHGAACRVKNGFNTLQLLLKSQW